MDQSEFEKRIKEICKEFDERVEDVGLAQARAELAKALAEAEWTCHDKDKVIKDLIDFEA